MPAETIESFVRNQPRAEMQRVEDYAEAIDALSVCVKACTTCADACLGETSHVAELRRCIRLSLDCADVCALTARLLLRHTEISDLVVSAQLRACVTACQACAEECRKHSGAYEHCHLCANACRNCQQRGSYLIGEVVSFGLGAGAPQLAVRLAG